MKNINDVKEQLLTNEILNRATNLLAHFECFLVGGFIRDLFLDKESFDFDIVCPGDSKAAARILSNELSGTFVELDAQNEIYRVVLEDKKTFFDVSRALNNNILDDAKRRDFTINSVFFNLNKREFFDPCSGILDIDNKTIKTCDINNIKDDPLRMLRAFRFSSLTGFRVDETILNFIKNNAKLIHKCANERICHEIIKLFEGDYLCESLMLADNAALLGEIFPFVDEIKNIPPNTHHHLDLFHHSLETMRRIGLKKPLLRLAAFCHDIGKPSTHTIEPNGRHRFIGHDDVGSKLIKPILTKLKFSKKQIEYISLMIKYHIYPSALMCSNDVQDKAKIRFIRKLDPYVEDIIELARADRLSARGPMVSEEMINENLKNLDSLLDYYYKIKPSLEQLPKLIDGIEIMQVLNIEPSPYLGEIIDALKEAQIEGRVATREDAIKFINTYVK